MLYCLSPSMSPPTHYQVGVGGRREDRCSNKTEEDSLGNSTLVSRVEIPTPEQVGKWEESRHSSNNQKGVLGARQVWRIGWVGEWWNSALAKIFKFPDHANVLSPPMIHPAMF